MEVIEVERCKDPKIQQIKKLLSEIKLDLREVINDKINWKKEKIEEVKVKEEESSLEGFCTNDRVKFQPTSTTPGGYCWQKDKS